MPLVLPQNARSHGSCGTRGLLRRSSLTTSQHVKATTASTSSSGPAATQPWPKGLSFARTWGFEDEGIAVTSFPATLRHKKPLAVVFALIGISMVAAPIMAGAYYTAVLGLTVMGIVAWRFSGMRLTFSDRTLKYRGWVREYEFSEESILRITRPAAKGWPFDRIYSWSVFEVATVEERVRINLLWFGPAASRAFHARFKSKAH